MLELKTVTNDRPFCVHLLDGYFLFPAFDARCRRSCLSLFSLDAMSRRGVVLTLWFSGLAGLFLTWMYLGDLRSISPPQAEPYSGHVYKIHMARTYLRDFYITWEQYCAFSSLVLVCISTAAVGVILNERWGHVVKFTRRGTPSLQDLTAGSNEADVKSPFDRT